jgi:hypothetical protein
MVSPVTPARCQPGCCCGRRTEACGPAPRAMQRPVSGYFERHPASVRDADKLNRERHTGARHHGLSHGGCVRSARSRRRKTLRRPDLRAASASSRFCALARENASLRWDGVTVIPDCPARLTADSRALSPPPSAAGIVRGQPTDTDPRHHARSSRM